MTCAEFRDRIPAYRSGNLDEKENELVGAHLATCPACQEEAHDQESCLAFLKTIDDIDPAPAVWNRIQSEIRREAAPIRRRYSMGPWIRFAAAASVLIGILSFYFVFQTRHAVAATVAFAAPGSSVSPGLPLRTGETFTAPTYAILAMPQVGTLKVAKGTELTFESPRVLRVARGEVFAEIIPGGAGFRIDGPDARVTVRGTRFGVRADGTPTTVYVVEGAVDVAARNSATRLTARQMLAVGGSAKPLEDEALRWIATNEVPAVALSGRLLTASPGRGEPLTLAIRFQTSSAAPVLLPPVDDLIGRLIVKVTDAQGKTWVARLEPGLIVRSDLRTRGPRGPVRLDVTTPADFVVRLDGALLPAAGAYHLSARFEAGAAGDPDLWDRPLESDPIPLEVN